MPNYKLGGIHMAKKYYAVRVGKIPGIYMNWDACKEMVHGYPGAVYKSFEAIEEAEKFINLNSNNNTNKNTKSSKNNITDSNVDSNIDNIIENSTYAFVDGSFNVNTGVYGYGGFLVHEGNKHIVSGSGKDEEMASMRNVAGEILGCMATVKLAIDMGIKKISIFYDYMGIEMWATGAWKRNKKGTVAYYEYMQSVKNVIDINFVKVKGHSGIEGNEEADRLAKEEVGIICTKDV